LTASLAWLGGLRDGILVGVTLLYGAGYLVWAFNAWQNNLGLLPALEFQYLVAGAVPVSIAAIAILGGRLLRRFLLHWWPRRVGPEAEGAWRVIRTVVLLLFGGSIAWLSFGPAGAAVTGVGYLVYALFFYEPAGGPGLDEDEPEPVPGSRGKAILAPVLFLLFLAALVAAAEYREALTAWLLGDLAEPVETAVAILVGVAFLLLPPTRDAQTDWLSRIYWAIYRLYQAFYLYGLVVALIVLGFFFYGEEVYPYLPQAFGGARPRCAYLDVTRDEISAQTQQAILPAGETTSEAGVVRSVQVEVLFSNGDLLMIRPQVIAPGRERVVYQLQRDNVQAITWCD
jgi:hypothetical protein